MFSHVSPIFGWAKAPFILASKAGAFPPGLRRPGAVTFSAAAAAADVDVDVERGARADLGVAAVAVRG